MTTRRLLLSTPAEGLEAQFAAIRAREGVSADRGLAAIEEAHEAGARAQVDDGRRDLDHLPFVTIDPEGSRDLDQALHIEPRRDGWRLFYAIADVGAHIRPGGAIDAEAWERAVTVYCPDVRIGLHPPELSEGFASLLPQQRTKAVVWTIDVEADGTLGEVRLERAWVRSRAQYSYAQLHTAPPEEARSLVATLAAFGAARADALARGGGVTLAKPSQEVALDGDTYRLEFRAALPIEDHNAQVSLATGIAAARTMTSAGVGVLRTMPPATPPAVDRLRSQARALGVTWTRDMSYGEALRMADGRTAKGAAFLAAAVTLFRGAQWEGFNVTAGLPAPEQPLHGALGVPYAHVTAPLRRLADRYATETCLALVAGSEVPAWVTERLEGLGQAMTTGVRRANRIDRACVNAVESAVLAPRIGQVMEAVGLDEDTVQLLEPAVVAICDRGVKPGEVQAVRLVSTDLDDGPRFVIA